MASPYPDLFNGAVIIVTGGCSGIGLAIAEAASASKAKVVVFDLGKSMTTNESKIHEIVFKEVDVTELKTKMCSRPSKRSYQTYAVD